MNRRDILTAAPFAGAAALLPAQMLQASPSADGRPDPIPAWFAEWKHLKAAVEVAASKPGAGNGDTPECLALDDECERLSELICTTPPVSREGAIAQLEYALADFSDYITGNIWKDLDAKLLNNLLAGLKGGVA